MYIGLVFLVGIGVGVALTIGFLEWVTSDDGADNAPRLRVVQTAE